MDTVKLDSIRPNPDNPRVIRAAMPKFEFLAGECNPETVFLPDRPREETLF